MNMDVGQAFRENRELQQFVLTDVNPTGRILGTGSFGSVEEVSTEGCLAQNYGPLDLGEVQTSGLCW